MIEHELVRAVKQSAGAESSMLTADDAVVGNGSTAERAVDEGDLHAAEPVQRHFVPCQYPLRIGAGLAVDREAKDNVVVPEVAGLVGPNVLRVIQRRNAIHVHPAPLHLVEPDQ